LTDFSEIEGLKRGDHRSFKLLLDQYSEKVFNLSLNILHDRNDAEDITQEVFTTVFLSVAQFKGDSKLSTWIYRITVNKCQEHIRKKSRKKRFGFLTTLDKAEIGDVSSLQANFLHPGIELENKERAAILFSAIDRLPENQRIAFTMHKVEGIPYEEIASIMEVSLSSVESLIFRARQNLKQNLGDYYEKNEK
jgi:RNA polymerase sigma-70 factor (ECF subfamily)